MTTYAPPTMLALARDWAALYKSAKFSGCVGDVRHAAQGGYHIGRKFQPAGNYSVVRPQDRHGNGPDDAAAALDMNLDPGDMVTCTRRLHVAFANPDDPRRKYINAFNGYTGGGNATRYDVYARRSEWASPDHKWHIHLEVRRLYVNSSTMHRAVLSLLRGQSVADYLAAVGAKPAAVSTVAIAGTTRRSPIAPAWPGKVYQVGDHAAGIAQWQRRMLDRGWSSLGTADGAFGPKTLSVVRRFQAYCKVPVDGVIGPRTWPLPWTKSIGG